MVNGYVRVRGFNKVLYRRGLSGSDRGILPTLGLHGADLLLYVDKYSDRGVLRVGYAYDKIGQPLKENRNIL